jgi:hypothetical protein
VESGDDRLLAATFGMYLITLAAFYFLNKSYDTVSSCLSCFDGCAVDAMLALSCWLTSYHSLSHYVGDT